MTKYVLETKNLTKHFGSVCAVDQVNLKIPYEGTTGLVGDNGAGKSTLIKMIYGVFPPTSGEIFLKGKKVNFRLPEEAIKEGIRAVHQIAQLVKTRKIYENFYMGREKLIEGLPFSIVDKKGEKEGTKKILQKYGYSFDAEKTVSHLSGGQAQVLEVIKQLSWNPKLLLLDEPTASLSFSAQESIFNAVKELKVPTLIISHNLLLILRFCDRIAILREGKLVDVLDRKDATLEKVTYLMIGGTAS